MIRDALHVAFPRARNPHLGLVIIGLISLLVFLNVQILSLCHCMSIPKSRARISKNLHVRVDFLTVFPRKDRIRVPMYISGQTVSPDSTFSDRSAMSSVDASNSSLAPGTSVPHTVTPTHSVLSVHRNIHVEEIGLSEVNAQPPQKRSNLDVHVSQTNKSSKFRERIQFFALCWTIFLSGWCDSSTGPLLLRIQDAYHVLSLLRAWYI
jgi:hypothetical protein